MLVSFLAVRATLLPLLLSWDVLLLNTAWCILLCVVPGPCDQCLTESFVSAWLVVLVLLE